MCVNLKGIKRYAMQKKIKIKTKTKIITKHNNTGVLKCQQTQH